MNELRVLVVDDEPDIRLLLETRLKRKGYDVRSAASGEEALEVAPAFGAQVLVTDLRMPGIDGFALMTQLNIPTLIITGHGDKESAILAVEKGAFAFFEKPFDLDAVEIAVLRAAEKKLLEDDREALLKKLDRLVKLQGREIESLDRSVAPRTLGNSPALADIRRTIERLADKPVAGVLVLGETGTGKEVLAHELHHLTHPNDGKVRTPFLALNCSAIPPDLFESELFGHEKGAFSGASSTRVGLAEAVREGTLFLDEVGELDPRHQAKLLRFLQERTFKRVGANHEIPFQGRVVAATHRNLLEMSADGRFREDLYYRLSIVTLTLPPLRERRSDLPQLVETLSKRHGLKGVHQDRLNTLLSYPWPGNVRELANWLERAAILGLHDKDGFVTADLTPSKPYVVAKSDAAAGPASPSLDGISDLKTLRNRMLDEYDRLWIERALDQASGNVSAAAKALGIDRKNLTRRIKELSLTKKAA